MNKNSNNTIYYNYIINIAKDFDIYPGGECISDGPFSGQEFFEDNLLPLLEQLNEEYENKTITIELDGVKGYAWCWLRGAFGQFHELFKNEIDVFSVIKFVTKDTELLENIKDVINLSFKFKDCLKFIKNYAN